ncbi:MAG: helix-turn-helix domain-containing protein [Lachnospiraceae bacterium]|nr:helix-turn-helix domain-containing protein [Lachnospiraceae bacterium]
MISINFGLVGLRIRSVRRKKHITQGSLAEAANLSIPYISLVENGHRRPSLLALTKISEALDLSFDYLLLGIGSADSHYQPSDLAHLLSGCSESDQRLLLEFLQLTKGLLEERDHTASE